jgi:hypothetical protein
MVLVGLLGLLSSPIALLVAGVKARWAALPLLLPLLAAPLYFLPPDRPRLLSYGMLGFGAVLGALQLLLLGVAVVRARDTTRRTRSLDGEVRGERGEPAAGTTLRLEELTGDLEASRLRVLVEAPATSHAQGRFRIDGLRPGRYRLLASRGEQKGGLGVVVPSGSVIIRLGQSREQRGWIAGRVIAPGIEEPVVCRVRAERRERPGGGDSAATEARRFALAVAPGEYDVLAVCDAPWPSALRGARPAALPGWPA